MGRLTFHDVILRSPMISPASLPFRARRPSRRTLIAAVALTLAGAVALLMLVDLRAVLASVRQADWRYLAAASAALLGGTALYALRWKLLLGGRPNWSRTFLACCVGHGVNLLLPLRLGEAVRIVVLGRSERLPYAEVASSVVVERLWEQAMRLTALAAAMALGIGVRLSPATVAGTLGLIGGAALAVAWLRRHPIWVLAHVPRWLARLPRIDEPSARATLARLLAGLQQATRPRQLFAGGLTSLGAWGLFWGFHLLALLALPGGLTTPQVVMLSLGALALAPPSSPTVPGVYHASVVVPLAVAGQPEALLTAYAIILHALLLGWLLTLGLVGLASSGLSAREVASAALQVPK